jgi:hypothetical protein
VSNVKRSSQYRGSRQDRIEQILADESAGIDERYFGFGGSAQPLCSGECREGACGAQRGAAQLCTLHPPVSLCEARSLEDECGRSRIRGIQSKRGGFGLMCHSSKVCWPTRTSRPPPQVRHQLGRACPRLLHCRMEGNGRFLARDPFQEGHSRNERCGEIQVLTRCHDCAQAEHDSPGLKTEFERFGWYGVTFVISFRSDPMIEVDHDNWISSHSAVPFLEHLTYHINCRKLLPRRKTR